MNFFKGLVIEFCLLCLKISRDTNLVKKMKSLFEVLWGYARLRKLTRGNGRFLEVMWGYGSLLEVTRGYFKVTGAYESLREVKWDQLFLTKQKKRHKNTCNSTIFLRSRNVLKKISLNLQYFLMCLFRFRKLHRLAILCNFNKKRSEMSLNFAFLVINAYHIASSHVQRIV